MKANTSLPELQQLGARKALMACAEKKHHSKFWRFLRSLLKPGQILPALFVET